MLFQYAFLLIYAAKHDIQQHFSAIQKYQYIKKKKVPN